MKRRDFLKKGAMLSASLVLTQIPTSSEAWNIDTKEMQSNLEACGFVDLNSTLPKGVKQGGIFSVSVCGNDLPEGVELTREGVLKIQTHKPHLISGVKFNYEEPKV